MDMTIGDCQLSKLYAYNGLMLSSGVRLDGINIDKPHRVIVVDNPVVTTRDVPVITVEDDGLQGMIHITLKYNAGKEKVITGLRRVSKPGLRVYVGADELPRVLRGLGIAIISTSKGVMTDKAARAAHVGGEVLAFVW
jgi:ribosomal protein S8